MYKSTYGGIALKTIHIEFSDERLITPSGLVFVGQILGKSNFVKKMNRARPNLHGVPAKTDQERRHPSDIYRNALPRQAPV